MLQVESQAILSGLCHLPFVVGCGGEYEVGILDAILAYLASAEGRTDERNAPVARGEAGFHLALDEVALKLEDVLRHFRELGRSIDVPAIGSGIAHDEERLGRDRFDDRRIEFAQILSRHCPLAQIECQTVFPGVGNAPFVVGIAGMHGKFGIADVSLRDLCTIDDGSDEGSVPTACCEAKLHLSCIERTFPGENQSIVGRRCQCCGVADVPTVGRGISHHEEGAGLDGQFALYDVEFFLSITSSQCCCHYKTGKYSEKISQFHTIFCFSVFSN